jgi:hypothetical protein
MQTISPRQRSFSIFRLETAAFRAVQSLYIRGMYEQLPALRWIIPAVK